MPAGRVLRFVLREGGRALVTGPIAVLALACFAVPYYGTWALSGRAPDPQSRAAWEVVGGAVVYGAWIAALSVASGLWFGGGIGAATAAGLVALAFTGLSAIERQAAVVRLVRAFLATRQTPLRARARLKRQRAAIAAVLERVHEWLSTREPGPGPATPDGRTARADASPGQVPGTEPPPPAPDGAAPRAGTISGHETGTGPATPDDSEPRAESDSGHPLGTEPTGRPATPDGQRPRSGVPAGPRAGSG